MFTFVNMNFFTDQCGHTIRLDHPPRRIVSLVPSQTELLHYLGLDKVVKGITKFCVHPRGWHQHKTRVGGTKQLKMEMIHQIKPDLIIANKEENDRHQIELLARHYPVWISDIKNLDDAVGMIHAIAELTATSSKAAQLVNEIQQAFQQLEKHEHIPVAYLIWQNPIMAAGGDTFINDMLYKAGFNNIFHSCPRYPDIQIEDLAASGCQHIFLSSEPYPFNQKHIDSFQEKLPGVNFYLVDGELFSWYGSRLRQAPAYFQKLKQTVLQNV